MVEFKNVGWIKRSKTNSKLLVVVVNKASVGFVMKDTLARLVNGEVKATPIKIVKEDQETKKLVEKASKEYAQQELAKKEEENPLMEVIFECEDCHYLGRVYVKKLGIPEFLRVYKCSCGSDKIRVIEQKEFKGK